MYEDEAAIPASAADNIVRDDDQVSSQQDFIEPSFPASAQVVAEDDVAKNEEITSFTAPLSASASDKKLHKNLSKNSLLSRKRPTLWATTSKHPVLLAAPHKKLLKMVNK